MQQLEIKYFFPLTEQIALDLDYTGCDTRQVISTGFGTFCLNAVNTGTTWATISKVEPSFCVDIDELPLTVLSKNKPNILRKYLYKILGVKWKAK